MAVGVAGGGAVGEDGPVVGCGDGDGEGGFEVGLVEGGDDALCVVEEELGVGVGLAVGGVGEAVHAFAGAGVVHGGVDAELVGALGEAGEGSRLPSRVVGSRGFPSRVAVWRVAGLISTKVSPAVRVVNSMWVVESKVWSPVVRSRSTR